MYGFLSEALVSFKVKLDWSETNLSNYDSLFTNYLSVFTAFSRRYLATCVLTITLSLNGLTALSTFSLIFQTSRQGSGPASACSVISSCAADESEVFRNVGRRPGCCCFCHFLAALRQWSWWRRAAIVPAVLVSRNARIVLYPSVGFLSRVCSGSVVLFA